MNIPKRIQIVLLLAILSLGISFFVRHVVFYYQVPIAKITSITEDPTHPLSPYSDHPQEIEARILNTELKGTLVYLHNTFSVSQAFSERYIVGQEVILRKMSHSKDSDSTRIENAFKIATLRRDYHILDILLIFACLTILIGGKKGFFSMASVLINLIVVFIMMHLYLNDVSIYLLTPIATAIFIFTSLVLVTGLNKKTLAAAIGTVLGTLTAIVIAYIVFSITRFRGVSFAEMDIAIKSPVELFFIQLVIGTLGAIMDIAVSIASSIEEILVTSPQITVKDLLKSGKTIGNDTMGTMTNTIMLTYLSGSAPLIILMLKSGVTLGYMLNVSLSLEILRAVIGSIGIVITIPITLIVSIFLLHPKADDSSQSTATLERTFSTDDTPSEEVHS